MVDEITISRSKKKRKKRIARVFVCRITLNRKLIYSIKEKKKALKEQTIITNDAFFLSFICSRISKKVERKSSVVSCMVQRTTFP